MFKKIYCFICTLISRFFQDDCMYRASALTYTTLLAIVPLMVVAVSILTLFPIFSKLTASLQRFIFSNFLPTSGEVIQQYLLSFVEKTHELSIISFVILIVGAILLLFNTERAFNHIWRVKRRRNSIRAFFLYSGILVLGPLLIAASFAISTYVMSFSFIAYAANELGILTVILLILPFVLAVLGFTFLYVAIPNFKVPLSDAFITAIIVSFLFECAKYGFSLYFKFFKSYEILYGALATIPIFFLWLYVLWLIILGGAELCHALTYRRYYMISTKMDAFTHAYYWLGYFWIAQNQGKTLSLLDLVSLDKVGYEIEPERQIATMEQAGLIKKVNRDYYVLNVDLAKLDFLALTEKLPWKLPLHVELKTEPSWINRLKKHLDVVHEELKQNNPAMLQFYQQLPLQAAEAATTTLF